MNVHRVGVVTVKFPPLAIYGECDTSGILFERRIKL